MIKQAISERHNYSSFIWLFESGKCEKEGKNMGKFECLDNEKSFWEATKSIFHNFGNSYLWCGKA